LSPRLTFKGSAGHVDPTGPGMWEKSMEFKKKVSKLDG
jgi:hypothetical protein